MKRLITTFITCALILMGLQALADVEKKINVWIAEDIPPTSKVTMAINTQNVPVVTVSAYRLTGIDALINRRGQTNRPATAGTPAATWRVSMEEQMGYPGQRDIYRTKEAKLPKLPPGTYVLVAKGENAEGWAVTNVTNLSVVVKTSPSQVLTWVCDATTGRPTNGAKVAIYKRSATTGKYSAVTSGTTVKDGTCLINTRTSSDEAVVVSYGSDLASAQCELYNDEGKLVSHIQTDRPIYRPGQTVYYKAILRRIKGHTYSSLVGSACDIEISDSKSNILDQAKATTSAVGTISGHYEIPTECPLGNYRVAIKCGEESIEGTFAVAEYRKPEFKVSVQPSGHYYLVGQTIKFELAADYYFGAPLPQATVNYKVHRSPTSYWAGQGSYYYSTNRTPHLSDNIVAEGNTSTDAQGKAVITIKTASDAPDSCYTIQCTIRDASAREVSAYAGVPVYASAIRVGVRTDARSIPVGGNIPLQLEVKDLYGNPTSASVTIKIEGTILNPKSKSHERKTLAETTVAVPASGEATANLPAKTEGQLTITATAKDSTGRKTYSTESVWVTAPGSKAQIAASNFPSVSIKLDHDTYAPGEAVRATLTTNTLNRPILVTAEGLEIGDYAVLPAGESVREWTVKATADMSPNITIQATQWAKNRMISGGVYVYVPDKTREIAVSIKPDKPHYQPGDTATFTVSTTGPKNKPVPAEVAVSVVDSAIYAIKSDTTRDLHGTFWGGRSSRVRTKSFSPEESSRSRMYGRGYARAGSSSARTADPSQLAAARTRFADTAYWNSCILTDEDGTAKLTFEVPGDLTTWKTTARAITADTKAGEGELYTGSSRTIMLRLAVPRQMVQGDKLTLIGTINNRAYPDREVEATISATGLRVEGETTRRVKVPADGQATVQWTIVADSLPENGIASITGQVVACDAAPDKLKELSDVLVSTFKIVPKGIQHRVATGGQMDREVTATVNLPADRIEPASTVKITVRPGLNEVVEDRLEGIINGYWCNDIGPAAAILAASLTGLDAHRAELNTALAALYGHRREDGSWGSWYRYSQHKDPETTATVLSILARAAANDAPVAKTLIESSSLCAAALFNEENLWERSALLASAATLAGHKDAETMLASVHENGANLSPFALLTLAEAYNKTNHKDWAVQAAGDALKSVVNGSDIAYLPAGEHRGWSATDIETTAQALLVLVQLSMNEDLQPKLAQWLVTAENDHWYSQHDTMLSALALRTYARTRLQSTALGDLEVTVNGATLGKFSPKGKSIVTIVPTNMLRDGDNVFALKRSEPGGVFYNIDARIFRPATEETLKGMRIMRRFEVQDAAGLWNPVQGTIKPSQPVRCSVVIWPNDRPDEIRIVEPIPSGFEFMGNDSNSYQNREEVRDGAVIHNIVAQGSPVFFRYYLRAESEGTLLALPATAEALRRPEIRGNTEATIMEIRR